MFVKNPANIPDCEFIGADHKGFFYTGRVDNTRPESPVIIWQGTTIKVFFTGKKFGIATAGSWGQSFFNVIIDGKIRLLDASSQGDNIFMLDENLNDGTHELMIFKRTESISGHVSFRGIYIEKHAMVLQAHASRKRIEFYGDSITAGACNEDPSVDQYDDLSTHNNYMSYGAMTARRIGHDYVNISISGSGICYSWNTIMMHDIYDRLYPEKNGPRYDFLQPAPDIVVINLGQNDYGYPQSIGRPFPPDFAINYERFARNIRNLYADAVIVCAIGGMSALKDSPELRKSFKEACEHLKADDRKIFPFEFNAFSYNHPRLDIHEKMAGELTSFLKENILKD